jgi:hypothetical protein
VKQFRQKDTVEASTFAPHGNFGPILARSIASKDQSCKKKKHEQNKV